MIPRLTKSLILIAFVNISSWVSAQTADNKFSMPLSDVVEELKTRYDIALRDPDHLVEGKMVTYALWRFGPDVEETMYNVFHSVDLSFQKEGDKKYKIKKFQYYRLSIDEAQSKLDYLSSLYNDKQSFSARANELRSCMRNALGIDALSGFDSPAPILTNKRKMDGYTVENIALEVLPGVFVSGSIYRPSKIKGKLPIVICPNGHFGGGRYRPNQQKRCATLAKMGAITISYDLFAWGESLLQFQSEDHHRSVAMQMQALNGVKLLDYLCTLSYADTTRIAVTGGSGGGSQTMLLSAIDPRIKVSVPVVMLSANHYGGCPCESGMPVHLCGGGTNNPEMAATFAPKPLLVISDGGDWTSHVPEMEFPFIQRIYNFYDAADNLENFHLPKEGHDYSHNKRFAMYTFMAKHLSLNAEKIMDKEGNYDESFVTIEQENELKALGTDGELLPSNALHDVEKLEKYIKNKLP